MRFHEKLFLVKEILGATSAELARGSELDPSSISRYLGARHKPARHGTAVAQIAAGAAKLADCDKTTHELRKVAGADKDEVLYDAIARWLNADDSELIEIKRKEPRPSVRSANKKQRVGTAQRLCLLMDSFNTTNAALARYVNVDSSSISRYRSGSRCIGLEDPILRELCRYFAFLCRSQGIPKELSAEIRVSTEEAGNDEYMTAKLFEWFRETRDAARTNILLEGIDSAEAPKATRHVGAEKTASVQYMEEIAHGFDGVYEAFLKFTKTILASKEPVNINICASDFSWFARAPLFRDGWTALMQVMLSGGHRIRIIHDLNLDAEEMFRAAESWIPLYTSGQVEPYYLTIPSRPVISEYAGVAEGLCSMRFSCFKGMESEVTAFFSNSPDKAAFIKKQFDNFLVYAKPLVKTYGIEDVAQLHHDIENNRAAGGGDIIKLMHRLSLESMPEHLAKRIFTRTMNEGKREEMMEYYHARRRAFLSSLSEVGVTEIYPEYTLEEIKEGRVPLCTPWLVERTGLFYTQEEFVEHTRALERLAEERSNYRCVTRADFPFKNIDIISKEGEATYVMKNEKPLAAFSFRHSYMNYVLDRYLRRYIS
ncbi:MAG: hypothetical protein RRY12_08785 [Cloacibacillus sp.]